MWNVVAKIMDGQSNKKLTDSNNSGNYLAHKLHYHSQLGLPNKGRASNSWDVTVRDFGPTIRVLPTLLTTVLIHIL